MAVMDGKTIGHRVSILFLKIKLDFELTFLYRYAL